MRTTSFKSRAFALVSTAALLATLVVASPANAAATGPTCDGATPVQTCTGTTSDGALYKMVIPATFNGTVTIWSHGFGTNTNIPAGLLPIFPLGNPIDPRPALAPGNSAALIKYLTDKGVAVMGSGFSTQAWNLDEAVKTNAELVGIFKAKFTTTKKVVAWGYSMGGGITQAFAEKNPELLAAAGVMNPVDSWNAQSKYLIDMLWLMKTWFDPSIKLTGYAPGVPGDMQMIQDLGKYLLIMQFLSNPANIASGAWPATSSASGKALQAGGIPARSALLMIGRLVGISTQSSTFDGIAGPATAAATAWPLAYAPAYGTLENISGVLGYALLGARDMQTKMGGISFDNQKTDYSKQLSDDDRTVFNAGLSGNTAIAGMLQTLSPLNPDAPRIKGDAAAIAKSNSTMYQSTGKIKVPTVMMIGQHDPVEPAGIVQRISDLYEEDFAAAKDAAKKAAQKSGAYKAPVRQLQVLWATTPKTWSKFDAAGSPISIVGTPGTGHTNFSTAHYTTLIDTMLSAAENGNLPWNGAHLTKIYKAKNLKIDRDTLYPWMKYYTN
jgi:pimeloyl-ACP methyl ester carboxylesterase